MINTDYDVKSGAVASKDSDTVYIDKHIPEPFHPFLAVHEEVEKHLMAGGMHYDPAHIVATLAEKHAVNEAGIDWDHYTDAVDPYVAKAEKESGKNPPPDPHVNIEDAIGHHADKASTLEAADKKIAANWAGEGSDMSGPHKPLAEDEVFAPHFKDIPENWLDIRADPIGKEPGYRVRIPKPALTSENDPEAQRILDKARLQNLFHYYMGRKTAMEDTYRKSDLPAVGIEGPGRPSAGSGGGSSEAIERPAIKIGDSLFKGNPGESHYHIMVNDPRLQKMPGKDMDRMESGWMTDKGRYVDREEAMTLAKKAEQIKGEPNRWKDDDFGKNELISEDFQGGRDPREEKSFGSTMDDKSMSSFLRHLDNFIPGRKK